MKSDYQIIEEIKNGNEYSYVILYERYKKAIFHFCLKMLKDEDTAKDIFQDIFVCVFQNLRDLKNPDLFKSWLYTIARNKCITFINKSKKIVALQTEISTLNNDDPLNNLISNETINIIMKSIDSLSYDYKEIIMLREYSGLSYLEIAQILNISESAVKSKLFKARLKLHGILKNQIEYKNN
jgi:RNA polymerase sigma-70 factor (ECF subfamily)